ncbi:MAG: hypothetical protein JW940_14430 [Polyangiaceae bacterium]|nr:hypothetical protein [Polyangiaceae bacterium]
MLRLQAWSVAPLVAFAAIVAGGSPVARAADEETTFQVRLSYQVDSSLRGCWDEAEFRRRIARRLGYDPFRQNASVDVSVQVVGPQSAIGGQVEWRNAKGEGMGERRFVGKDDDCAKLLAEMGFAVGLQIELLRRIASGEFTSEPSGPASGSTAPSPPAAAARPPVASPAEKRGSSEQATAEPEPATPEQAARWAMWVGLGPSLAWGISPSTDTEARLFFGARRKDLSLELGAEASYPSTHRRWYGSGFRGMLISATAGVCGHYGVLAGCALAKAGQIRAQGLGLDEPRSPTGFVGQAGLRLAATIGLTDSWFVAPHLDSLALLTPCRIELNDVRVWHMPWLSAFAGIDLGVRLR